MASILCTNCAKELACHCDKRVAIDGKSVCYSCLSAYERSLQPLQTANLIPAR